MPREGFSDEEFKNAKLSLARCALRMILVRNEIGLFWGVAQRVGCCAGCWVHGIRIHQSRTFPNPSADAMIGVLVNTSYPCCPLILLPARRYSRSDLQERSLCGKRLVY